MADNTRIIVWGPIGQVGTLGFGRWRSRQPMADRRRERYTPMGRLCLGGINRRTYPLGVYRPLERTLE